MRRTTRCCSTEDRPQNPENGPSRALRQRSAKKMTPGLARQRRKTHIAIRIGSVPQRIEESGLGSFNRKYGFRQYGRLLAVEYENSKQLIDKYIGDE